MAINPPTDIVLDVAKAADPLKLQAAALKLTGAVDGGDSFTGMVDGLNAGSGTLPSAISAPGIAALQRDFGRKGSQLDNSGALSGPAMKPYRDFEGFVLQSFIQSMLPHDAQNVFGEGTAGEMWKGLLAEQLGKQLARAGGIGIAKAIYKAHPGGSSAGHLSGLLPLSAHASGAPPSSTEVAAMDVLQAPTSKVGSVRTR